MKVPEKLRRHRKPWVWLYRPEMYWFGWATLIPVTRGHDEFSRVTIVFGWTVTGRIIIPLWYCGDEECYEQSVRWIEYDDED